MGLATYKQIRFIPFQGRTGNVVLVINRPGYTGLTQPAADTLEVHESDSTHAEDYFPYLIDGSDFFLSKKFVTTKGRRAIDDLTIQFRDGFGYTGKVNGSWVSENFLSSFETFFDVWFDGTAPYKAFILYTDSLTATTEVTHEGWIDPAYKPSADPFVVNPGTISQIWLGTRTIKITAFSQAQLALTWKDVLATIGSSDCQDGQCYNGFMFAPPGCSNKSNTRANAFSSSKGNWFQACPHYRLNNGNTDPNLTSVPAAVWPTTPWAQYANDIAQSRIPVNGTGYVTGDVVTLTGGNNDAKITLFVVGGQIQSGAMFQQGTGYSAGTYSCAGGTGTGLQVVVTSVGGSGYILAWRFVVIGGSGYAVNDTGTIAGGTPLATYKVLSVDGSGGVLTYEITSSGGAYTTGVKSTTATTGTGTGFEVLITKLGTGSTWGPSGLVFIKIGTLFTKIAALLGLDTFTPATDLVSALDFFLQKSGSANNFPLDTTPLDLTNLWISLNVFAKAHPYDGSFWDNPVGWSPDTPVSDIITGLCNFLLIDFNDINATDGTTKLQLTKMGATASSIPTDWEIIDNPTTEEPATAARIAQVNNKADKLVIQAPFGIAGDAVTIETPIRLHRIATTGASSNQNTALDTEATTWDAEKKIEEQADECFKVVWFDGDGNPVINPNCWKGLANLYFFESANTNLVYGSNWSPFNGSSWANSFYAVNACFESGQTPAADLQAQIQGNDYFNSRCYHVVAFAALNLPLPNVQVFQYAGIADGTGSIQNIGTGMGGTWRDGTTASQNWRSIEVSQSLLLGKTVMKWQAQVGAGGFPALTDIAYGALGSSGGTSSTTGGSSGTGGTQTPSVISWSVVTTSISSNTNDLDIGTVSQVILRLSSSANYTLSGIATPTSGAFLYIVNVGTNFITLKNSTGSSNQNQFLFSGQGSPAIIALGPNGVAECWYDTAQLKWRVLSVK